MTALTVVGALLWEWNLQLHYDERRTTLLTEHAAERQQDLQQFELQWHQSLSRILRSAQTLTTKLAGAGTGLSGVEQEALLTELMLSEELLQSVALVSADGSVDLRLENWGGRVRAAPLRLPEVSGLTMEDFRPGEYQAGTIALKTDRGVLVQPWTPVLDVWTVVPGAWSGRVIRLEFRMAPLLEEAEEEGVEIVDENGRWIAGADLARRWGGQLGSGRQLSEEDPDLWQAMAEAWQGWRGDGDSMVLWHRLNFPDGFAVEAGDDFRLLKTVESVELRAMLGSELRRTWLLFGAGSVLWCLAVVSLIQFMCHYRQRSDERAESAVKLLEASPFAVCIKSPDGRLEWGNPEFDRLVGATGSTYGGKHVEDLFEEDDPLAQEAERDARFLAGAPSEERSELRLTPKGRPSRYFIIRRIKYRSYRKREWCLCWMLVDVTRVRQLEGEAERLGKQLQDLTARLPGVVFQALRKADGELRFEYVSAVTADLIGIRSEAFVNRPRLLRDAVFPEDRARFDAFLRGIPEVNRDEAIEYRILDGAGRTCWMRLQAAAEQLEGDAVRLFGYFYDITDEHAREGERRHNAGLLQALFDSSEDIIYCKDRESRLIAANRAWLDNFAPEPETKLEDIVGKTDFDFFPESTAKLLFESEQELMRQNKVERQREEHRGEDGSYRYLESVKSPLCDEYGKVRGLVGISRDVTPQVELEENLLRAKQDAEASTRAKSEFLAVMSHEIRTPMNGVIGAASLLGRSELDERQQNLLRTIRISGENLLVIINDILDYSKIEAGKVDLEQTSLSLADLVSDLGDLLASQAAEKGLELVFTVDPQVPDAVMGDPVRLRQVLLNLLGNALKFTETGEIKLQISLDFLDGRQRQAQLSFEVADTGIGIPEHMQSALFKAFSQVDASNTRKYGGTGLGLVICQRLVGMMGGQIELQSKAGEGSRFSFSLQLPVPPEFSNGRRNLIAPSVKNKRVLVVDDNETNLGILKGHLTWWGLVPLAFSTPKAALEEMRRGTRVDAAILDFQMPEMDGVALARALRALPDFGGYPILLLSSVDEAGEFDGIQMRMMKPINPKRLLSWLEREVADETAPPFDNRVRAVGGSGQTGAVLQDSSLNLLVAEDNEINQEVILEMLKQVGCQPVLAKDGQEALDYYRKSGADIILMDIQMPVMDGLQATREIRKLSKDFSFPWIIALTAGAMEADRERAQSAGVNDYLTKPLVFSDLKAAVERGGQKAVRIAP